MKKSLCLKKPFFFGIRDPEEAEMRFVEEKKAKIVAPGRIDRMDDDLSFIGLQRSNVSDHVLAIIVDIDVLDPACAPGTGILRAGGFTVRQVLHIIRKLCKLPFAIKIGEICEVIPEKGNRLRPPGDKRPDPCGLTVLAAEAILREMIHRMQPQS